MDKNINDFGKKQCDYCNNTICLKQNIRFIFFFICSLSSYSFFMWNLLWKQDFLSAGILFCILFIELIFLSIDIRGMKKRYMRGILLFLGVIFCFFVPNPVWQVITSVWLSLITIGYLLIYLRGYFSNVRKINRLVYFTRGGYIFTLMTTITFGFAILGINTKFPFQCSQISGISETLFKNTTSGFFFIDSKKDKEKSIFDIEKDIKELQGGVQDEETLLSEARGVFKSNMIDGFIETKNSINKKVCEAIVSQIDQIYKNPVFQVGVVFGIYLLFYGIIRLLVWIITIMGYILFTIVRLLGLYNIEKKEVEVEDVL